MHNYTFVRFEQRIHPRGAGKLATIIEGNFAEQKFVLIRVVRQKYVSVTLAAAVF